ncbi:MAG: PIG-L family deacetylase [Candidatus Binatia bacterium]
MKRRAVAFVCCAALLASAAVRGRAEAAQVIRPAAGPSEALVVVSPHPDDESLLAAGTIHRLASDPRRFVRAVYLSGGDRATVPGPCNGIPERVKAARIVRLREGETRAAWRQLAPGRRVPIAFLRGPDTRLVASTSVTNGIHDDVLSREGAAAVERAARIASALPRSVQRVRILTTARYDAHPDHRAAHEAARRAADVLRARGLDVELWSGIVHDEIADVNVPICCIGDLHWPVDGPVHDYAALTDAPERPRPPYWDRVEDVRDVAFVRETALAAHASQVDGYAPLCMPVPIPEFYTRFAEKVEEPFWLE